MKKLKKFTIEALRREMPVLEEAEKRGVVGGSGSYLTWDPYANLTVSNFFEKQDLLNMLMAELGFNNQVVVANLFENGSISTAEAAAQPIGNIIYFNAQSTRWTSGNVYDIALILVHEMNHLNTTWNNGSVFNETEAYWAEVMHPFFSHASAGYQSFVLSKAFSGSY